MRRLPARHLLNRAEKEISHEEVHKWLYAAFRSSLAWGEAE
jgi:hypothetical protein